MTLPRFICAAARRRRIHAGAGFFIVFQVEHVAVTAVGLLKSPLAALNASQVAVEADERYANFVAPVQAKSP